MGDSEEDFEVESVGEAGEDYDCTEDDGAVQQLEGEYTKIKSDYRKFSCLNIQDADQLIKDLSGRTSVVVQLPQGVCQVLLCKYNWDTAKLISDYGTMDIERFLINNDLRALAEMIASLPAQPEVEVEDGHPVDCPICLETISSEETAASECGHKICLICWRDHLRQKVEKETSGFMIQCPVCPYIISDRLILELMPDPAFQHKLRSSQVTSFVESSSLATWCPAEKCSESILVVDSSAWGPGPVICGKCNLEFCFACSKVWHAPLLCKLVDLWHKKVNDSDQTMDWIRGNSKPCPKCGVHIEKNGGCNAMKCSKKECGYEFCWICLGRAHQHNFEETCSKITAEALDEMKKSRAEARRTVEYFLFHSDRYYAHMRSLKLEENLPESMEKTMMDAQDTYVTRMAYDTQWIKNAIRTLRRCRMMLAYSYAFSFYLEDGPQVKVFQTNLNNLHVNTEQLSFLLEQELKNSLSKSAQIFQEIRNNIMERVRFCDERRLKVVSHVMEGYESGVWTLSVNTEGEASAQ